MISLCESNKFVLPMRTSVGLDMWTRKLTLFSMTGVIIISQMVYIRWSGVWLWGGNLSKLWMNSGFIHFNYPIMFHLWRINPWDISNPISSPCDGLSRCRISRGPFNYLYRCFKWAMSECSCRLSSFLHNEPENGIWRTNFKFSLMEKNQWIKFQRRVVFLN